MPWNLNGITSLANLVTSPSEVNQTAIQWLELTVEGHTQVYKSSTLLPAHGDCISDRSHCEAQHVKVLVNLLDWGTQTRPWHETLPLTEGDVQSTFQGATLQTNIRTHRYMHTHTHIMEPAILNIGVPLAE